MSNYTKTTNFASKDNLSPGNPLKIVKGTEIDTEFNNIQTAVGTKTDNSAAAITGGTIVGITDLAVADGGTGASTATAALNNLLPTQTGNANKYLQTDGTNATWDAVSLSTSDITGTLPVANGGTGVTSSTGTGSVVLSNSPTLVTPALGTPASGTATNLTGLPISTGVSGLGTGVATFLVTPSSANLLAALTDETGTGSAVFATSPTLVTPALGTPSSATLTNATGLPISTGVSGLGTGVATFLGTPSSANLLAAVSDETGTGALVFATSPTLVTPALGTPASGVATNLTGLPLSTGVIGTLPVLNGGTGVTTSTGSGNNVLSTSPTLVTPILGTPTSATLTNATGLPLSTGVTGTLPVANGGTGQTSYTDGQLLIGNTTGNTLTKATLTAGTGITVTNSAGGITIAASGGGGAGDVVGPASSTDNALARFDLATGKLLQNSVGILSDTGAISGLTDISASGAVTLSGGTANGVTYLNGSKVLTSGSALQFTGSNLSIGIAASANEFGNNLQINQTILNDDNGGTNHLSKNAYYSSGWKYISTDYASKYTQSVGTHQWSTAPSGTAGNAVTFTEGMRLTSTGLGIGTSSPTSKLTIGSGSFTSAASNTTGMYTGANGLIVLSDGLLLASRVAGSTILNVDTAGNLGLGVTPNTWSTGKAIQVGTLQAAIWGAGDQIDISGNAYFNSGWKAAATKAGASLYEQALGVHTWSSSGSVTADSAITFTQVLGLTKAKSLALEGATSQTGTGITFPATQSASSDANTLDDYEEGTWTPTLSGGSGTIGSQTYSNQQGFYTKVGRMVTLTGYLQMTNKGSWTGGVRIGGFPFVVASGQQAYSGTGFYNANLSLPAGGSGGGAYPVPGVSYASMFYNTITGTPDSDYSYINNNTQIGAFTIVYFTN